MHCLNARNIEAHIRDTRVLLVDDDFYMRKLIRTMLLSHGIKDVHDVHNGSAGLDAICTISPDLVFLDWEMPDINGAEFMRRVRSPATYPVPGVPIVMLTSHNERETVVEAVKLGVNEFLCKPVSAKSLYERIVAVRTRPRPMVRIGNYYGPEPRKMVANSKQFLDPTEPSWLI